jgi:Thioredoxin
VPEEPCAAYPYDPILIDLSGAGFLLTSSQVDPIQEELRKRQELERGLVRPGSPSMGPDKAPVTLAVFSDFQCPYCARFADTMKEALADQSERVHIFHRLSWPPVCRDGHSKQIESKHVICQIDDSLARAKSACAPRWHEPDAEGKFPYG